jgi:hypothetical protein
VPRLSKFFHRRGTLTSKPPISRCLLEEMRQDPPDSELETAGNFISSCMSRARIRHPSTESLISCPSPLGTISASAQRQSSSTREKILFFESVLGAPNASRRTKNVSCMIRIAWFYEASVLVSSAAPPRTTTKIQRRAFFAAPARSCITRTSLSPPTSNRSRTTLYL